MAQSNNPVWILFRSLTIVFTVSLIVGGGFGCVMHSAMAGIIMFVITTVAQFAMNAIIMGLSDRRNTNAEFLADQVLREASQRQMPYDLNCAYCNTLNRTGISFNNENTFVCNKCNQPNKVYIQFTTVRVTTPLTTKDNITAPVDMGDEDAGVTQSTVNQPIKLNEK